MATPVGNAESRAAFAGHRRRVWAALACAATLGALIAQLLSSADALFLSRVGGRHLGTAFAVSSAASVALLWGLGALADCGSRARLLYRISLLSLGVVLLVIVFLGVVPRVTAGVLLVVGKQIGGALELLLWLVVADRFTAREARKLLPWIVVANGAGATLGALSVGALARGMGVVAPLWSAALLLLVVAGCARLLMRAPDRRMAQRETRRDKAPLWSGLAVVRNRPLAAWLAVLVAAAGIFAPMMYYVLSVTAAAEFPSEVDLVGFLGRYRAYVQAAALVAQLVAAPWLSRRLGVGLMLLLAPIGAVAVAMLVGGSDVLLMVALAQGATRILDVAIQTPSEQLIQNLLPEELRGRVAGIVGGVAKRTGSIVGGLLASFLIVWPLAFHTALFAVALGWLLVALLLWRRFASLAVAELSGAGGRPKLETRDVVLGLVDGPGLIRLGQGLGAAQAREQESALSLLHRLGALGAVDVLLQLLLALETAPHEDAAKRLRAAVRRALGAGMAVTPKASRVARTLLGTKNSQNRALAMVVLGCGPTPDSEVKRAIAEAATQLGDLGAEVALARIGGESVLEVLAGAGHAAPVIHELRCEISRAEAGRSNDAAEDLAERLLRSLARCSESAVQLEALDSVVGCLGAAGPSAMSVLLSARLRQLAEQWRGHADPALREASLVAMCAGGEPEMRALVHALGDRDESVRERADVLVRKVGDAALEALSVASYSGRSRLRMAAVEILADLRPSDEALQALLDREIEEMVQSCKHSLAIDTMPGTRLVRLRLQERVEEAGQAALLALEALGNRMGLAIVARRLARAVSVRSRARALEALDTLLPRRLAGDMLGALEGTLERTVTAPEAIEAELRGTDRLTRDLLVHALGREGRAQYRQHIAEAAQAAQIASDPLALVQRLVAKGEAGDAIVAPDVPNLIETIAALSELPLFADLQTVQLEELAAVVQWRHIEIGETLMEEGDRASSMFFVRTGSLHVVVKGQTVATLGAGEPVGELGLFSEDRRSATVVAASDALLGMVSREDIENLVEEVPGIALRLCRAMSRRLAQANAR